MCTGGKADYTIVLYHSLFHFIELAWHCNVKELEKILKWCFFASSHVYTVVAIIIYLYTIPVVLVARVGGFWSTVAGFWSVVVRSWSVVGGFWSVVVRSWSVVAGFWSIVAGFWSV